MGTQLDPTSGTEPGRATPHIAEKSDYEKYIRTDELLALQKASGTLACSDELQFQMVHQVEELWMKLILHALVEVESLMGVAAQDTSNANPIHHASHLLERCRMTMELMTSQLRLLETMTPNEYHKVRTSLGKGSGAESPGWARLREAAPRLWRPFETLLAARKVELLELQMDPYRNYDLYLLSEGLLNIDEGMMVFRDHHLHLVRHIIGGDVPSLKGVHASRYLTSQMKERFFPDLWDVRNQVSRKWGIPVTAQAGLDDEGMPVSKGGGCPFGHGDAGHS